MILLLPIIILVNSYLINQYFIEFVLNRTSDKICCKNIIVMIFFQIYLLLFLNMTGSYEIFLFEILILLLITMEDEFHLEISVDFLALYLILKLIMLLFLNIKFSFGVFFLGNLLFIGIYISSKGGMGLGDVLLNGIMTIGMDSVEKYFLFFVLTFSLGALFSIIGIASKKLSSKDQIGFVKFMVMANLLIIYMR